ncbi:hypothetical protein T310_7122 [Rasamsonia emersonii CBS 393.64]|uniref:Zn(2)-C6 fungal-type domain-containing protein n=1 Tax=Rasamsonia emersonii (strain ATCC 16479 / CBS 393.64 / IMI 116815) TaxID=1408163 RepID=A0A0F4YKV3_RASE3|nr:hypothetical protein T310_7122 [Rasamsonia emersonii CBS 393.64]KKA18927.1 hypothetical protein T310_7122 [Rasamsonia emersonii CBS 393.64]
MLRRNGRPTFCEPCRLSKVRCDHTTPRCRRCEARGAGSKCFYHPAPLTRPKRNKQSSRPARPQSANEEFRQPERHLLSSDSPEELRDDGGPMAQTPFLGSTSYLSVFYDAHPALSRAGSLSLAAEFERWRTDRAYVVRRLTKLISAMAFYEDVIRGYYDRGQFTVIPAPLVLDSLHHARSYLEGSPGKNMLAQEELYAKISENTAKSLRVRPTMRADEFYSLFTGENLRWEFIGFIFALAGIGF